MFASWSNYSNAKDGTIFCKTIRRGRPQPWRHYDISDEGRAWDSSIGCAKLSRLPTT